MMSLFRWARSWSCRTRKSGETSAEVWCSSLGMKQILLLLILITQALRADSLGDEVAALKINLPAERRLSSNELRQALELAHGAGMSQVVEIRLLKDYRADGLFLTSGEVIKGRRIARQELTIWNQQWRRDLTQPNPDASAKTNGSFALNVAPMHTREWATFTIGGKEMKIECGSDTDLGDADKVFAALYAKRVVYSTKSVENRAASSFNFYAPRYISIRYGEVRIGFVNSDRWCGDSIQGKMNGDRLIIEDAMTACA